MAISYIQGNGVNANNTTGTTRAFSSGVTLGSLIVVVGCKYSPSNDPWAEGDCTKSSGDAVIGTISLDRSINIEHDTGLYCNVAIWSAIVTSVAGGTSLTMGLSGAPTGSYMHLVSLEAGGNWGANRAEDGSTNSTAANDTSSGGSGNATSAGAALFVGGLELASAGVSTVTITEDAAFSLIYENGATTDNNGSTIYRIVSSGTTDAADWTFTGDANGGWAAALQVYKEAVAQLYTYTAAGGTTYAGTPTISRVYIQAGLNDLGETALLEYIVGKNTSPEQLVYRLFTGSTVPAENSTVGDFTEVTGGGYANKTLVGSSWTVSSGSATHPQLIYTFTGSIDNGPVVGYYVTRKTTGDLIYAERSSFTFNPASDGDAFLIRPTISLD